MKKHIRLIFFLIAGLFSLAAQGAVFTNRYFTFTISNTDGSIEVTNAKGEKILSSWNYFSESFLNADRKDTLRVLDWKFQSVASTPAPDGVLLLVKGKIELADITVRCELKKNSAEAKFSVETRYAKKAEVIREALLFNFDVPVSEVYRKNRQEDVKDFEEEYWLDKEGAKFGSDERQGFIYHATDVSSLQLNTGAKQLVVNLDYYKDHPFLHFPLLDTARGVKQDLSFSIFKAGQTRKNSFSILFGKNVTTLPRLMESPNGYLSAFVFTEHADWSDMPTHRAVYFGSEDIVDADKATAGFVKNKIPVTKSVFYANPDSVLNSQSSHKNVFTTPIASIKGTPGFLEFLKQLSSRGFEICLHTPDQYTAGRPLIAEALTFMKTNFNSVSWIDHGYENGPKNNREDFVCDALDTTSKSYSRNLWEKNGVKYLWNPYFEDYTTDDSLFTFNASQVTPYIGFGDAFPTPVYWKHPTRTAGFYSWCTRDLLEMPDVNAWNYHFSAERLNDFVKNWQVKFSHCYPSGGVVGKGFWKMTEDKKIVIEPEFEKTLERLAALRDSGLINLTTVRELLNYQVDCEKIKFEYLDNGSVKIINANDKDFKGLALAVQAAEVTVDGKTPSMKKWKDDLIFWFDMKAKGSAVINFK